MLNSAIKATHPHVGDVLKHIGKGFYDDSDGYRHLKLLQHTLSIAHHREKRDCITVEQESIDIYNFNGNCLIWSVKINQAKAVYDAVLEMQFTIYGLEVSNIYVAAYLHQLGIVNQRS